jgi:solute carrier family 13 (sodium-dependent dicarboxylate transporter), member 2/3/5
MSKTIKLLIAIGVPLLVLALPSEAFGIPGLTVIEHRVIAIFFMALFLWVLEPIPLYATSLLIILAELVLASDSAFLPFRSKAGVYGKPLPWKAVIETFADPIIILFLGGFFLAMVSTKYALDIGLARLVLKPFGTRPKFVLLGFMLVTAAFSMFMSNTAATAMMLAVMAPVLKSLDPGDKARAAFVLAIPVAANIGGIGTPVGTPPNGIALKYLTGANQISFGSWMAFGVPFMVIVLFFAWALFLLFYRSKTREIRISITGKFRRNWKSVTASVTFAATILLWMTDFLHGMNAYLIALVPVVVYSVTRIVSVADLREIDWDVLWLMAGGIALGLGMEKSGLVTHIVKSIAFGALSPALIIVLVTVVTILFASFMSHTATANLLLPVMAVLGTTVPSLASVGGTKAIVLASTFASSLAMALPVSTPPNALAYATGEIKTRDMVKTGVPIGIFGLLLIYAMLFILRRVHFL